MATWLTTSKMSPALRARIEASIGGRKPGPGRRFAPRAMMTLRALCLAAVVVAIGWGGLSIRRADQELEAARVDLLNRWQSENQALTAHERAMVSRVRPWLEQAAKEYAGDWVGQELRSAEAFASVLKRPSVYVRGKLGQLAAPQGFEDTARESVKDAFTLCLMDPPQARTEQGLLLRVRSAYTAGVRMRERTAHVERVGDALVGLGLLDPSWRAEVVAAESRRKLARLRRTFERAPLAAAQRAAKASLLLFAIDEPGDPSLPTELDGERPHAVRVGLVDLVAGKPLLRLRRRVDPSWLSDRRRAEYARGMDSCALAFDVHQAVAGRGASAPVEAP